MHIQAIINPIYLISNLATSLRLVISLHFLHMLFLSLSVTSTFQILSFLLFSLVSSNFHVVPASIITPFLVMLIFSIPIVYSTFIHFLHITLIKLSILPLPNSTSSFIYSCSILSTIETEYTPSLSQLSFLDHFLCCYAKLLFLYFFCIMIQTSIHHKL